MSGDQTTTLLDGLRFAEGPRWRDGKLWFSDIFSGRVMTVTEQGDVEVVVQLDEGGLPSGLGFLPDGRLLFVAMHRPFIMRLDAPGLVVDHADLSTLASGGLNDMVVDSGGRAYVGSMGTYSAMVTRPLPGPPDGNVILVEPDGSARVVAQEMDAPNGPIITNDGSLYVVAEFPAQRLIAFDRAEDGSLANRRIWADLKPGAADGIAVDCENGIWTASPREHECRRVVQGGRVTDVIKVDDRLPLACCLGGADGRTLFILSAVGGVDAIIARTNTSIIETARVDVPAW